MPINALSPAANDHPWFSEFARKLDDGRHFVVVDNRLFDHLRCAVGGTAVGIHEDGPKAVKIFGQPRADRSHHVADRGGIVEAGDADEHLRLADLLDDGFRRRIERSRHRRRPQPYRPSARGFQAWSRSTASSNRLKTSGAAAVTRLQFEIMGIQSGSSRKTSAASLRPFRKPSTAVRSR